MEYVKKLINKDKWIIDGNYSKTFDERFNRSDLIIFLDVSRANAYKGIIKRRIKYNSKKRPDMPDGWEEKLNKDFLKFVWKFHDKNKQEIKNKLVGVSKNKVIAVKSKRELRKILSEF